MFVNKKFRGNTSIIDNSGTPSINPDNPIYGENYLQNPFRSMRESIVDAANYVYDGALVGMAVASCTIAQELIRDACSTYIAAPEKDLTCLEPSHLHQLQGMTILTGALVSGVTGAIGLNPRLCSTAASTALVYAGLFSQELIPDTLYGLGTSVSGLAYLSLISGGFDRLRDINNTLFNDLQ